MTAFRGFELSPESQAMALKAILDRGIRFEDNVDCRIVTYTSNATPDTEDSVPHDLRKVPVGYIVIGKDAAGDVYDSSAHTSTDLKLKCSVASVTITLIVI